MTIKEQKDFLRKNIKAKRNKLSKETVLQKITILSIVPFSNRLNIYPKDRYDLPVPAAPLNIEILLLAKQSRASC